MAVVVPGNPGVIKGSLIGLKVDGNFISCETSCDFNCEIEMLPSSAVTSGRWKEVIPGLRSWTMSVNMNLLLGSVDADVKTILMGALLTGDKVFLDFHTKSAISPSLSISGYAYPQTIGISAPGQGIATSTITFQGSGPFTTQVEQFYLIINAQPIEDDKPVIVDTTEW